MNCIIFRHLYRHPALLLAALLSPSAAALTCPTPGKDGVGTAITGIVNTYYPGAASAAVGATTLSLGTSTGSTTQITPGDLLLVVQMQDATLNTANTSAYGAGGTTGSGATAIGAGKYEYVVATSSGSGGGSVSIKGDGTGGGLINSYTDSAYGASGAKRFQIIRVPQYSSATLGAALSAPAWNGSTGGVVAIDVAGSLGLNSGTISVSGLGFRGGGGRGLSGGTGGSSADYRSLATSAFHAQKGEGIAGTPRYLNSAGALLDTAVEGYPTGSSAQGAPGNAGGGGNDGNPASNDQNSGGGGGSGAGAGGKGGRAWSSQLDIGGRGGTGVTPSATALVMGGGGGAGTTNNATGTPASGFASSGAAGGGVVLVRAGSISGTGSITANGSDANNTVLNDGSGGGGGGGTVLVTSSTALPTTLSIYANGGAGGTNTGGGAPHGPGGGGGGGAIVLSGTGPTTLQRNGGAAGTTAAGGTDGATFGAIAGTAGTLITTATPSVVPGANGSSTCFPALSVTKSTSTPSRVQGVDTTATYTVTLSNTGGGAVGAAVTDVLPSPLAYTGTAVTPTYAGGASGPASVTGSGTTTAVFGTAGGTSSNSFYIPSGGSVALTFSVNLNSALPATYQNPATAAFSDPTRTGTQTVSPGGTYVAGGTAGGSNYASGSSTAEDVTVTPAADLAITKTDGTASVNAGAATTYTIRVTNNGPSAVTGATLTDVAATGLSKTTVACSGTPGQCTAGTTPTVTQVQAGYALPALASGQFYELTVTATVTATSGSVSNVATIAAPGGTTDPTPGNNSATDTDTVTPAIITLQKVIGVGRLASTDQFTLSIGGTSVTTTGTGTSVTSAAASLNPATVGTSYTVSETAAGTTALANYTSTYACTNTLSGGQTPSGSGTSFSVTPAPGDTLSCTFTNTLKTYSVSGRVYEDYNYGGGAGRAYSAASGMSLRPNVRVELYNSAGTFVTAILTDASGAYSFTSLFPGTYTTRVVNSFVTSSRTGACAQAAGLTTPPAGCAQLPVQTYVNGNASKVGGELPAAADPALSTTTLPAGAESIAAVTVGSANVTGVDFGFNFDTVVNVGDSGQGSLRQFVTNSNALTGNASLAQVGQTAGKETSIFMVPSGALSSGVAVIPLASGVTVTDSDTSIDGGTQTANVGNTNTGVLGTGGTVGVDGLTLNQVNKPEVEITVAGNNTVQVSANNFVLRSVALRGGGNGGGNTGELTLGTAGTVASNALIEKSIFGTTASAFTLPSSGPTSQAYGISVVNGSGTIQNNLIGYSGVSGINYVAGDAGLSILGNELQQNGYTVSGGDGITDAGGANARPLTITGNLIANSNSSGIQFEIGSVANNTVSNNTITANGYGGAATRLEGSGIHYLARTNAVNSTNTDTISKNVIFGNQSSGVVLNYGQQNVAISQNSFYSNGITSIDFTASDGYVGGNANYGRGNGVTPNDGATVAREGNKGQDYPVFTTAYQSGTTLTVAGAVGNGSSTTFDGQTVSLELYKADDDGNQNGAIIVGDGKSVAHGEGRTYLGTLSVTLGLRGTFSGTVTVAAGALTSADKLTATATTAGNTSEFSPNIYNLPPTTVNLTNATLLSTAPATTLSPNLAGSDADGTISSFTVVTLPSAASGVLALAGTPVSAGQSITAAQLSQLTFAPTTGYSGTASFTFSATDNLGAVSNISTYSIPVSPVADLTLTKTDGVGSVNAGGTTTYTITLSNAGPNSANGTVLTDPAAAGLSKTGVSCVAAGGAACPAITPASLESGVTVATLPSGGSITLTVTANVTATSGSVTNSVTAALPGGTVDPTPTGTVSDTDSVTPIADLSITKTDGVAAVNAGGTTTYTIRVTNTGPSAVTGATLTDVAATGLTKTAVACSGTPGQCTAGTTPTVTQVQAGYALPALASGQFYELTVTASVTATSGSVSNVATIAAPGGTTDPTPGNNSATDTDTVTPVADLAVTKTDGVAAVNAAGTTTYTVRVTNNGPSSVTGATLTDAAVSGLTKTAVACSGTPGQCTAGTTPTISQLQAGYALPALASGAFYELTVTASVTATSGSVANTATVAVPGGTTDSTPGNNSATDTDTVTPVANLGVTKTDGVGTFHVGSVLTYTVVVSNAGPSAAVGATVSDPLPAGIPAANMTYTASAGSGATTTVSGTQTGALADTVTLASGSSVTYTVTITVPGSYPTGTLVNTATVTAPGGTTDPSAANNSASDTDTREAPVANNDAASTNPLAPVTFSVTGNDTGPVNPATVDLDPTTPGQQLTYTDPGKGLYTADTSGNVTFVPAVGFNAGTSTIPYVVKDALGVTSNVATITVTVPVGADLGVVKTGPAYAKPGETLTYTITVTNATALPAAAYTVTDTLPTGLTFVSASNGGTYNSGTRTVTWALVSLAGSAQQVLTLTATAPSAAQVMGGMPTVQNTATVALAGDPTSANNTSSATTRMILNEITKQVRNITTNTVFGTSGGGKPGEVLEYCLAAHNLGGADLGAPTGYVVTDALPSNVSALLTAYDADEPSAATGFGIRVARAGTTYLTSAADADTGTLTTTGGTYGSGTLTVNLGTVVAGETVTTCFQATIR